MNIEWSYIQNLYKDDNLTPQISQGLIQGVVPLGAAVGCLAVSVALEYISRKWCLILTDLLSVISLSLQMINNFPTFVLMRFISGFAVGVNSTLVPIYVKEMSPVSVSGLTGSMTQVFINVGLISSQLLGLGLGLKYSPEEQNDFYWRFVILFPCITCILRVIFYLTFYNFDTPFYYMLQNEQDKAKKVIESIYLEIYVENKLEEYAKEIRNKKLSQQTWGQLFKTPVNLYKLKIGCLLQFLQQFIGINAIVFYSSQLFEILLNEQEQQSGDEEEKLNLICTVVTGCVLMFAALISGVLTNNHGRKQILEFGMYTCTLCMILIAISQTISCQIDSDQLDVIKGFSVFSIFAIFIFILSFGLSLGPIVWIYNAEILTEKGVAFATIVNWISAAIIGICIPILYDKLKPDFTFVIFYVFSFFGLAGIVLIKRQVIETKGLDQNEINNKFELKCGNQIESNRDQLYQQDNSLDSKFNSSVHPFSQMNQD